MSDMTVANTILAQLGGRRFRAMTGARNFVGSDDSLSFRLPGSGGFCKDGINAVHVVLTPMDEYDMKFMRVRGTKVKTVCEFKGIYFDQLQPLFTEATGLETHL